MGWKNLYKGGRWKNLANLRTRCFWWSCRLFLLRFGGLVAYFCYDMHISNDFILNHYDGSSGVLLEINYDFP